MQKFTLDFAETGLFNNLITDYIKQKETVKPFYKYAPTLESFAQIIEERKKFPFHRETIVSVLQQQYAEVTSVNDAVKQNIDSLKNETTFTVTTGHQLSLFTGPLYVLYKIISTINLAKTLKEKYTSYNFVPVYWMASEDHDFAEINHIHLFNKKIEWKLEAKGTSGELPTETIADVLKELKDTLGDTEAAKQLEHLFENAYLFNSSLAGAMRALINVLFGKYGLVIVDGNNQKLKKIFIPVMEEELLKQTSFEKVNATSTLLTALKYKPQVNPRNLNLFFIEEGLRERIVQAQDGDYEVVNTNLKFTKEFMVDLLHKQPEHFSPNVVLRPLYQETVLPNIAYVGGPGEISYWLQYKSLFDYHTIHYPALILRNNVLIMDAGSFKKMEGFKLTFADLFKPYDDLAKKYIAEQAGVQIDFADEIQQINNAFVTIAEKATLIEQTLTSSIKAEQQKTLNSIEAIDKKILAAIKRKHDTALNQIKALTEKVFPNKTFQERYQNFIPYYLKYDVGFINDLVVSLKSFDNNITVLIEKQNNS